jgi:hypothetical protein
MSARASPGEMPSNFPTLCLISVGSAVADDLYATHFGSLASWAVSRFTVVMRIARNPRTLFNNLFGLFVAVASRPACSISDTRSRWRWTLMLASATWALAIRSRSSRVAWGISEDHAPGNGLLSLPSVAGLHLAAGRTQDHDRAPEQSQRAEAGRVHARTAQREPVRRWALPTWAQM